MEKEFNANESTTHMRSVCHIYTFIINYNELNKKYNIDNANTVIKFLQQEVKQLFKETPNDFNINHGYIEYSSTDEELINSIEQYFTERSNISVNILNNYFQILKAHEVADIFYKYDLSEKLKSRLPEVDKKASKNKI